MKITSFTFLASIVVALCCLLSLGAQAQVSDNFNAGNDTGWTRYDPLAAFGAPATFSFPNGGYRIQAPASPDPLTLGPARAGSLRTDQSDASDFGIFFDVVGWDNAANQSFGALGRATSIGLGTTDGYGLTYSTAGSLDLVRIDNEVFTILDTTSITLDPAKNYRFLLTEYGTALTGTVYDFADLANPLAAVGASDATYSGGVGGLFVYGNSGSSILNVTFDNFASSIIVPEPSVFNLLLLGSFGIFCARAWRRGSR